jgi:hypothetical protein
MGNGMEQKTRFIQHAFYTDYDRPSDYLVIVEVVDDIPTGNAYIVKVPVPFMQFPLNPYFKN